MQNYNRGENHETSILKRCIFSIPELNPKLLIIIIIIINLNWIEKELKGSSPSIIKDHM